MIYRKLIIQTVFLYLLFAANDIFCAPVGNSCQPPANLTVSYQKLNQGNDTVLKFFVPPSYNSSNNEVPEKALTDQCDGKKHDEICPKNVSGGNHVPVYARSTCPWTYAVDHDPLRFPSTILLAKPRCTYCIGSNDDLECNPITHTIRVLRRGECTEGLYQYYEFTQEVTIGFTCAGRRTVHDKPDDNVLYEQFIHDQS
ncbi:hypothetical protein CHS0354_011244 [Potamilus streckersoni]|uniref:Uncharacterized protein n=1 Tax=Potamilus streckersoni TaxID=2493646 RepID=A0AAE0RN26_9BIVA|nr:hypothetical protein CHS0354_011244 [Potamilus streckersoni]